MLANNSLTPEPFPCADNGTITTNKRKRRPAGTPDPDAEVVSLSPKTLLESDQYVCEICNQGFQRDQNLQMHRRRHKVPWKLLKRRRRRRGSACSFAPSPRACTTTPATRSAISSESRNTSDETHSNHKQWLSATTTPPSPRIELKQIWEQILRWRLRRWFQHWLWVCGYKSLEETPRKRREKVRSCIGISRGNDMPDGKIDHGGCWKLNGEEEWLKPR
ncbi:hypothetical protein K1719_029951 [Acacia pycnantha]|nr:hypothetical protein K1719_029951 [Acacia pycnantha]